MNLSEIFNLIAISITNTQDKESIKNCVNIIEFIFSENKKEKYIRKGYPGVLFIPGFPFSPIIPKSLIDLAILIIKILFYIVCLKINSFKII